MRFIELFQKIARSHGIIPTYVVDFPVAAQKGAIAPLREYVAAGQAEVGAHLHPWVNPPFIEPLDSFHSYPGNLEPRLERQKLEILRDRITDSFGRAPIVYRAGRHGLGPRSFVTAIELGFKVDTSPAPAFDLRGDGGPDYSACPLQPFWVGREQELISIPITGAFIGPLADRWRRHLLRHVANAGWSRSRLIKLLTRLRLVQRIRLSPEGHTLEEMKALSTHVLSLGVPLLVLTFHSPTVMPGGTPYARTVAERDAFLRRLDAFMEYALHDLSAEPITLSGYWALRYARDRGHAETKSLA